MLQSTLNSLNPKTLQARQEAEDAALLVDYTGSLAKGKGPGQQSIRQQPTPLQPPASHWQHAQPAPKQRQSRKGGQFRSWSNPSQFSTAAGETTSPQLLNAMQLDNHEPMSTDGVPTKHSDRHCGGPMLNIDIDDDDNGTDDCPVSMPGKHSDRQCRGALLTFDIDDDIDDQVNDCVSASMSGRQHEGLMPRFDIDDDDDDDPDSAPMFGSQHGRQCSSPGCRSDTGGGDDAAKHNPNHDLSHDPRHDPGHDLKHEATYDPSHNPSRGPSHEPSHNPSHDPRHDPNHHGRKQEMPSAAPLTFDIDDSDDNDAAEAATDPMDPQVEAPRGKMRQKVASASVCVQALKAYPKTDATASCCA